MSMMLGGSYIVPATLGGVSETCSPADQDACSYKRKGLAAAHSNYD